ncbi:MAG TPA: response regulator [Gemmataceae bacterium]|jgi:signal transduction histidine kinase/DNA-binding response OmpR family regulator|nr:response regulator [Gemmataceae bacterium]
MSSPTDKTNILLVDDLPEKLLIYRSVLEELGENLVSVESGVDALKQVLKHDFAVILLDVQMPEMDGFETAQLIRQRKRSSHTPIIFLTAFADEVRTSQGYATGAVDYIATPVVPEILRAKVRVFVELFRMRQQVAHQVEDQAKREAAEEAARRSAFLADASRGLASSLDFEATLRTLGRFPVPQLGDTSLVALTDVQGRITRSEISWADPIEGCALPLQESSCQLQPWLAALVAQLLASTKLHALKRLHAPAVPIAAQASDGAGIATSVPPVESVLVLPLAARNRVFGVLILARRPGSPPFDPKDVALAEELSGRAAIALDNALLVRDIQEADRHKNEFLAMLAHELRNPLAPIKNAVELLRMQNLETQDFDWARDLIDRQVTHLVRLVDDLLDVSRITRGKIRLEFKLENAANIVSTAVETSRPLIEAHKHQLTVTLPEKPLWLMADATRLAQVLSNLLTNAAKYTPDGGSISLSATRENDLAIFRVRDTGEGIPREMLARIFEMFAQVDQSLARSHGGLGVGLTLVRRLIEMHEGSVQAHSDGPGRGSEFIVRLPAHSEARSESETAPNQAATRLQQYKSSRILLVDDNVDAAESLAIILEINGHEVHLAHDGLTALDAAGVHQPDAVLLDIGLPGLNGYQVAERLRAQPETKSTLLIAVSGYGQEEDLRTSRRAGFDHHLIKPVNVDELLKLLAQPANMEVDVTDL